MKHLKILIISGILIFLINCTQNYRVTYVITGDAPSVTINSNIVVTELPWWDEHHEETGGYNSDGFVSGKNVNLNAKNNTSGDSTLTAMIFVNGELESSNTSTGPYCTVSATATLK